MVYCLGVVWSGGNKGVCLEEMLMMRGQKKRQGQLTVGSKDLGGSDWAPVASILEMPSTKESATMKYLLQAR
jgi:hypothetical protein